MRRAADSLGTTDIVKIIRTYKSPSFGFASRNFFPSFLAALTIDTNPGKYFPGLKRRAELAFTEVEMPAYVSINVLQKTLQVERSRLIELNPAFRPALLEGTRFVPRGYRLRLPAETKDWTTARLAQQLDPRDQYVDQPRSRSYKVRKGDSFASIGKRHGMTADALAKLNGLSASSDPRVGRTLRLTDQLPARVAGASAAAGPAVVAAAAPTPAPAASAPAPQEKVSETLAEQRREVAAPGAQRAGARTGLKAEATAEGPITGARRRRRGPRQ